MSARAVISLIFVLAISITTASARREAFEPSDEAMRPYGMTYAQAVRQARAKKERGLAALFGVSTSPELDGARAEMYASHIRALLDIWGDKGFAAVLRKQSPAVRKSMWRWLRDIGFMEFSRRYPEAVAASYP